MTVSTERFITPVGPYIIKEDATTKALMSPEYNYVFNKQTGFFARWGKTRDTDPDMAAFGPEIMDIEITTSCDGPAGKPCHFCYKSNTKNGSYMTFETFKTIFDKLPRTLTQIAFGADATLTSNPDIWKMFEYCRNNGKNQVIPNVTVANISDEVADKLVKLAGAVAVSRYADKNWCYDTIDRLHKRGMKQVNIHALLSQENLDNVVETINDVGVDPRLDGLNAIVFLSLKKVGRGTKSTPLTQEQFNDLMALAWEKKISFGMDSCSSNKFIRSIKDHPNRKMIETSVEPCESTCFSLYANVDGKVFACSFSETGNGISLVETNDFMKDVWYSEYAKAFRNRLLTEKDENDCRKCPLFEI